MSDRLRRRFVLGGLSVAAAAQTLAVRAQTLDTLQTWLKAKVAPVRAIDARDEDFADLKPLGQAIGSARVVQLGEPSHGAGSAFAAKARIVKFLHQRLGFDVLIWESGFFDVTLAQAAIRSADDAATAAGRGVFALWSRAAEIRPLFDAIKASQTTERPLEMAGFDMQVTADGAREGFAQALGSFAQALRDPMLRVRCAALAEQAIAARGRLYGAKFAEAGDLEALSTATRGLGGLIAERRADFDAARGALDVAFMARAIENMQADAEMRFEAARSPPTTPERESRRDALNASNLRWLLEEKYAGRKAVVWAHNAHVMNAYYAPDFHDVHLEPRLHDMKPTGVFLKGWLGDGAYTLGVTAFQGQEGFATGGPTSRIAPAPKGSLEARFHDLGDPYAFLDFRASRRDRRSPLHALLSVRIPKFESNAISDVGRIYDGVFFIDRMAPAKGLPSQGRG